MDGASVVALTTRPVNVAVLPDTVPVNVALPLPSSSVL